MQRVRENHKWIEYHLSVNKILSVAKIITTIQISPINDQVVYKALFFTVK